MTALTGSIIKPEGASSIQPTSREELDGLVNVLSEFRQAWIDVNIDERIALLQSVIENARTVGEAWVAAACDAKGISLDDPVAGEEWHAGPVLTIRNARLLIASLQSIRQTGQPTIPGPVTTRPNGQTVAQVFPADNWDKVLWQGYSGEVWMQPGVTPGNLSSTMATIYQPHAKRTPELALVLGAGNIASIAPTDTLYKMFVEDAVVILKMNPVNEYIGPFLEQIFAGLIGRDFMGVVYGGSDVGSHLVNQPKVDSVHITGSDKTHDAIVFGSGPEGAARKAANEPLLTKPISSELGNVSPVIVVPGPWSERDLAYQGENIAGMLTHNAGFNCIATRIVVTHEQWNQREALLDAISDALHATPDRDPYYPGARERWEHFQASHPSVRNHGKHHDGAVPWTLIHDLDTEDPEHSCFAVEAFAGIFGEAPLKSERSVVSYIQDAVRFANETAWGTLGASLIVHPASLKDPEVAAAVEQAVADLRYGTVGVNVWTGLGFAFMTTSWGAFPGHPLNDIRSGRGVVHNTLMFGEPQKSVIRGPFRQPLKPLWFASNKQAHKIAKGLVAIEAQPSALALAPILGAAVRG